jgi:pimeloyl-ACP methyl ester carboxylesterase
MGFVKARGSNFYYEEQGEGLPILLIPPSGSTASTWGTLVGDLAGTGRVIAYDRRGYSRSGGEVVRSASAHALDAAAVLEALNARPAVVVGTSAGATIALDLAVRRPDLVRAVVVHEAAWRALRHPSASGLVTLARMQWLAWRPPPPGPGDDHRTGRVHLWVAKPPLHALHHALAGPGRPDGEGT